MSEQPFHGGTCLLLWKLNETIWNWYFTIHIIHILPYFTIFYHILRAADGHSKEKLVRAMERRPKSKTDCPYVWEHSSRQCRKGAAASHDSMNSYDLDLRFRRLRVKFNNWEFVSPLESFRVIPTEPLGFPRMRQFIKPLKEVSIVMGVGNNGWFRRRRRENPHLKRMMTGGTHLGHHPKWRWDVLGVPHGFFLGPRSGQFHHKALTFQTGDGFGIVIWWDFSWFF